MHAQNTILLIIILTISCDEDLKIRIGLPEYICDKDGGVRDVSNELTTIRLLGKDALNVSYNFDVNFRTIGKKCYNDQRCTLMKWKAVRELDHYLKNYPVEKLRSGLIQINNTMFDPGVKYIINVQLISQGKVVEEKQLSLDYVDDAVRAKVKKPMASLLLLAPDTSYAFARYVVNAEVNVCSNISAYYFTWEVTNSQNVTQFPTRSAELAIPANTFQASQTYTIKCTVVGVTNNTPIAESQQTVTVLSKGLLLRLPIKRLTTRRGNDVQIKAYVKDLDNIDGEIRATWSCIETTTDEECQYDSDTSELDVYSGFDQPGTYKISLEISKSEFTESDSCIVVVMDNAAIVEIEDIEFPTNPTTGITIEATIYELRTFCTLQWTAPEEEGYESVDLSTVPGNVNEVINVTMKEDLFLYELEEFSNDTIDKKHDLVLPPPSGNWEGLKGDRKYLFRLTVTCPIMDDPSDNFNTSVSVTSTTDIVVETNSPPVTQSLDVAPLQGVAFITTFTFKTQRALDKDGDGPTLYKFGFTLNQRDIVLWTLGEVTNCEATLPYSDNGVPTFLESCDSFGTCGRLLGPTIQTKLPDNIDKEVILQRFIAKIDAKDYDRGFTEAFIILSSYKSDEDDKIKEVVARKVNEEVEKYVNSDVNDVVLSNVNELMRNINEFNSDLQLPEDVINNVVRLRNKFSDEPIKYTQRQLLSFRGKRASSLTVHDVQNYLEISELIITTSNDLSKVNLEKEYLRKQLRNHMEKLCTNMKKTQVSLELKTVIFSVEKLKKNSLNNFISVPFEANSWQVFGRVKLGSVVKDSKDKCVGKAVFRDYLDKSGITYFVDVLNAEEVNEAAEIVIFLPKNKSMDGTPKCLVYYNNGWRSECKKMQNIANYVKCTCKHLGYYYLEYTQTTNSPAVTSTTLHTHPTTPLPEKILINASESSSQLTSDKTSKGNYDTVSYVVIAVSVIGIIILAVTVRKIFHDDDENEESETFDFPKYAQLHNEEFLNDAHI
ncbi:hypothetical protein Zmor_009378 [Zophobas morio]|uniref:PKD/REJ-like domain-containing protein n=1 Tax=Zophobas morio TaxID=2755281 RepID=A0AA38IME1_9CUCU|nr:hypothetical protein Zmor_009378 [Zophobas morio]